MNFIIENLKSLPILDCKTEDELKWIESSRWSNNNIRLRFPTELAVKEAGYVSINLQSSLIVYSFSGILINNWPQVKSFL